jgi:AcrR family transcriptional regulator
MLSMAVSDATPLRADAQRNLERILEAARASFAEYGLDVGVEAIARRAGVGKATFFRRFPTKDALVLAVLEGFVADMEELADRAAAMDDPWEGVRQFMVEHARMQADNAGFFDAMAARFSEGQQFPEDLVERTMGAAERALEPAQRAGLVREGVTGGDLMALLKMLGPAIRPIPSLRIEEARWSRYVELLLSGIRAGQPALPGVSMDLCDLARQAGQLSA